MWRVFSKFSLASGWPAGFESFLGFYFLLAAGIRKTVATAGKTYYSDAPPLTLSISSKPTFIMVQLYSTCD
jgi:hypothetical protein